MNWDKIWTGRCIRIREKAKKHPARLFKACAIIQVCRVQTLNGNKIFDPPEPFPACKRILWIPLELELNGRNFESR